MAYAASMVKETEDRREGTLTARLCFLAYAAQETRNVNL